MSTIYRYTASLIVGLIVLLVMAELNEIYRNVLSRLNWPYKAQIGRSTWSAVMLAVDVTISLVLHVIVVSVLYFMLKIKKLYFYIGCQLPSTLIVAYSLITKLNSYSIESLGQNLVLILFKAFINMFALLIAYYLLVKVGSKTNS